MPKRKKDKKKQRSRWVAGSAIGGIVGSTYPGFAVSGDMIRADRQYRDFVKTYDFNFEQYWKKNKEAHRTFEYLRSQGKYDSAEQLKRKIKNANRPATMGAFKFNRQGKITGIHSGKYAKRAATIRGRANAVFLTGILGGALVGSRFKKKERRKRR